MKVALCISGHMRTFKKCYKSILKHIADPLDADIFISTWDTLGFNACKPGLRYKKADEKVTKELLQDCYKDRLKLCNVDHPPAFYHNFYLKDKINKYSKKPNIEYNAWKDTAWMMPRIYSMWHKINDCNELSKKYEVDNKIIYQVIIRSRPDLFFSYFPLNINFAINGLYIPGVENYGGWNDQFGIANRKVMHIYADTYNHIDEYVTKGLNGGYAESFLKHHLLMNNIGVKIKRIEYQIVRRPN